MEMKFAVFVQSESNPVAKIVERMADPNQMPCVALVHRRVVTLFRIRAVEFERASSPRGVCERQLAAPLHYDSER